MGRLSFLDAGPVVGSRISSVKGSTKRHSTLKEEELFFTFLIINVVNVL